MVKIDVNEYESLILEKSLRYYTKDLKNKIEELDGCSSHFFVNEGLMNEVRREKEKIKKELQSIDELLLKVKLEEKNE